MGDQGDGEKTEAPTPKRLADARKKGDVSKSKDFTDTATLFAAVCTLSAVGPWGVAQLAALLERTVATLGVDPAAQIPILLAAGFSVTIALLAAGIALPFIFAVLTEIVQVGPLFTTEKLKFDLNNLNPTKGIKKIFSVKNLVETTKSIIKVILITIVAYVVCFMSAGDIFSLAVLRSQHFGLIWGTLSINLIQITTIVFLFVSVADYIYQRHSFMKNLKMSVRDIKQEFKNSEGDPMVKSFRKQIHHEISAQEAQSASRRATVLLANPTHFAVALDYDPLCHAAPVMTARGAGRLALSMRAAAEEVGVPVVVKPELARGLFAEGVIGDVIPEAFFVPIAEIIAWANQLKAVTGTRR